MCVSILLSLSLQFYTINPNPRIIIALEFMLLQLMRNLNKGIRIKLREEISIAGKRVL